MKRKQIKFNRVGDAPCVVPQEKMMRRGRPVWRPDIQRQIVKGATTRGRPYALSQPPIYELKIKKYYEFKIF